MSRLLIVLFGLFVVASSPLGAQGKVPDHMTMPLAKLEQIALNEHPSAYFILALRKFEGGEKKEAVHWLYIGQIRWRFHIAVNPNMQPDGDPALLASMMEVIGRPINEWAGSDIDGWVASMKAALDWDSSNSNGFTDKSENVAEHEIVRSGLSDLIVLIEKQRDNIPGERARNGLGNRLR